jgi:iron complex outermembrane recepter protein
MHNCADIPMKLSMRLNLTRYDRFAATRIPGFLATFAALGLASTTLAQDPAPPSSLSDTNSPTRLPEVIVTGQKQPAPVESLPVSDSVVTGVTLTNADIQSPKDASIYAPNTFLSEFTARAQSVPYFRGIGGGLGYNPGVTTFIDGVPQLNFYSANIELLGVDQVEFLRGPQGDLFGRNTAGGLINITSTRPTDYWTSQAVGSYGNYGYGDFRGSISGPIVTNQLDMSLAGGYSSRDGYTTDQRGNGIDGRVAEFGKGQLLYKGSDRFEMRLIAWGENDRDGDYALGELNEMVADPHVAPRVGGPDDGYNNRDIAAGVVQANYRGEAVDLASISGASWFRNDARTDWDYAGSYASNLGPAVLGPYAVVPFYEDNIEQQRQFTQEFRAASSKDKPIQLADALDLSWQSGLFFFSQSYHQYDSNFGGSDMIHTSSLDDLGTGVYGQVKLTAWEHLDFTAGVRYDYENKTAQLGTVSLPPLTNTPVHISPSANFGEVSPAFGVAWHYSTDQMVYTRAADGYKAGGFNPEGSAVYGPEHSWDYELGQKALWLDGKLETTAALFYIDWRNLQEDTFNPLGYYIINTGGADSKGVELETKYRPLAGWDLFGSVGYTDARFQSGAAYLGGSIAGNRLPNAPEFTGNMGTEVSWSPCRAVTLYGRAEVSVYGDFEYDPSNMAGQSTYSIANFRAGVRGSHWFAEGWVNNAFNTSYVPIAFNLYDAYNAPGVSGRTGYVGEDGQPLTFGFRAGIYF